MLEKRTLIIHPFIFAVYPILFFLNLNRAEMGYSEIILPIVVSLVAAILIFAFLKVVFNETVKAAILTSLILILFFSYEAILTGIAGNDIGDIVLNLDPDLFWSYGILLALVTTGVHFLKGQNNIITEYLNWVSVILILFPLMGLANHKISSQESEVFSRATSDHVYIPENFNHRGPKPDIYYIIMDAYLRDDIMNEFWGFDNSEFNKFLTNRGFYVAPKSRSNYPKTVFSLASSLNMEHLPTDLGVDAPHELNNIPLIDAIEKNRVVNFLKSIGYLYVHLSNDISYTNRRGQADIVISNTKYISYFLKYLLNKTFFKVHSLDEIQNKRNNILYGFEKLEEISEKDEPTFTFAHFMMPHGPQAFDENGDIPIQSKNESEKYFGELLYANKKIKHLVDHILANSEIPPIILIQGDHGFPTMKSSRPDAEMIIKRYSILSAYYLPGQGKDKLYETITPVNSFRLIFDHYFGTQFGLLEDKSYLPITYTEERKFIPLPNEDSLSNNGISALVNSLKQTVFKKPGFAEAHAQLGRYYIEIKRYPEAIASLEKALNLNPDLVLAHIQLAEVYSFTKNHTKALDIIRHVIRSGQKLIHAYSVLGGIQMASGHHREALSSFNKVLEINPNHLSAIYGMARAYSLLNEKEKSISYFRKAVLISPSYNSHNDLGYAYASFNHLDKGIKELKYALAIKPNFAEAHYNLGYIHVKKKKYQQGISYYKKAIEHRPDYLKAYFNLGVTYELLNKPLKAIEYYQKIVAQKPDHMLAHFGLGNTFLKSNQIKAALLEYQKALKLNPDHIPSYISLGNIQLFHLGRIDQARKTYEVAILKQPKNAEIHRNLGIIYSQMNKNPEKAIFHFQESIHLAPKQLGVTKIYSTIQALRGQN